MFDDAALVLEEIAPEDKNRKEVLGARVVLYMAAKKWNMAAAVANHLVKVEPENEAWWINFAYALRRTESVEKAEAILLRAQAIHPQVAIIAFNLACYASVTGRMGDAKERLRNASSLIRMFGNWRSVTDGATLIRATGRSHACESEDAFPVRFPRRTGIHHAAPSPIVTDDKVLAFFVHSGLGTRGAAATVLVAPFAGHSPAWRDRPNTPQPCAGQPVFLENRTGFRLYSSAAPFFDFPSRDQDCVQAVVRNFSFPPEVVR